MKQSTVYINIKNENLISLDELFEKRNINKYSSLRQIFSIIKIRLKIFLKTKSFFYIYVLIPFCLLISIIFTEYIILKEGKHYYDSLSFKINENIIENKGFQWIKDTTSTGQALDIINIIGNETKFPFNPINYNKELTIKSGKLKSNSNNYIGGFKGKETDQDLEFIIYHNNTHIFSVPVALNHLSNALLKYNNINEKIEVTYVPFYNEINDINDDNTVSKIQDLLRNNGYYLEPLVLFLISFVLSFSISIYGPLIVKEREFEITHQLLISGTKQINYWIAVIISDAICILVPIYILCVVSITMDISIFTLKYLPITIIILTFWTYSSLLQQYIICHFFKKYDNVSSILTIINPVIAIFNGVYSLISYFKFTDQITFSTNSNLEISNIIYSYISVILYTPGSISIPIQKYASIILDTSLNIFYEEIEKFISTKEIKKLLSDNNMSYNEKIEKVAKELINMKQPSVFYILREHKQLAIIIITLFLLILIYAFILYFLEKRKIRQTRKSKIYSQEERDILDNKLKEGPKDVYNEWKRVKQSLNNKIDSKQSENNNVALKICELNKDFKLSIAERRKYKKEIKKNSLKANQYINLNHENYKEDAFDFMKKLDNRIYYNKKEKKYINRIVEDTTYGVNHGECLGILGPNGAGKTTSISMITGIQSHTHGQVVYGDKDLNETELTDLSLGYCSQIDALWKELTVKETIEFYLDICGYPKKDIPRYIKALTETCGIESHVDKKVKELSGGTRRKLSLIVAICSSPKYLILDEPSVGMDPFTRRYMWRIITELKKARNTSIILTTHSTEEAEALCERIAILIEGRLVFIDTPKSIKMNYNHKYTLEVSTNYPHKFEEFINKNNLFGLGPDEKYQLESSTHYQKYFVEMKTENISRVFSFLEQAKEKFIISQYNFGQYSFEQVYINFINNIK